jgi:hypothetical protein
MRLNWMAFKHAKLFPLVLRLEDFVRLPDLLAVMPPLEIQSAASLEKDLTVAVADVLEPVKGAAFFLTLDRDLEAGGIDVLLNRIQERRRCDLLERLRNGLKRTDSARLDRAIIEERHTVSALLERLHEHWRHLDELAEPVSRILVGVYEQGERHRDVSLEKDMPYPLLGAWLERVCQHATLAEAAAVRNLQRRAARATGSCRAAAFAAIHERSYLDAQYALGEASVQNRTPRRETLWRAQAKQRFPDPVHSLVEIGQSQSELTELIGDWRRGIAGGTLTVDRPLRTKFARLMFASQDKEKSNKPRGDNSASEAFIVNCKGLAQWITDLAFNPSYVPQLHSYSELVILTPLERVASPALIERLRSHIAQYPGRLCVFLTPRLQDVVRQDILRDFAIHGLTSAVVDDLDLCRLLNPGGRRINLVLGLLEIILEQQNRRVFSPFARHDGQHMRSEMNAIQLSRISFAARDEAMLAAWC